MSSALLGISSYVKKLEDIAEACGEGKGKKKDPESKDEFVRTKKAIYEMLTTLRQNIRERQALQKRRGNSHEAIERGVRIREQIRKLDKTLPKLQEVHRKQQQKRLGRKPLAAEEIEQRFEDIRVVKRQLEEAKQWFNHGAPEADNGADGSGLGLSVGDADLRIELFGSKAEGGASSVVSVDRTGRALNEDETSAMDKWKQKDAEFDQLLDEIGNIAERLNPLAQKIGHAAERQNVMVQEVIRKTDKAEADVKNLNTRIRNLMNYQKNTTFFCQLVLGIALLTGFGYVYAKMRDEH